MIKKGLISVKRILICLCILALVLLACIIVFRVNAEARGQILGNAAGTAAGRVAGSLAGLTEGQIKGYEAGKNDGLHSKDTQVELSNKIKEVEKLEVLVASGSYSDILSIGSDYAALISQKYNAVFTVDLSTADIQLIDDKLNITLETPKVEFYPIGEPDKVSEYMKESLLFGTGSTNAGMEAYVTFANECLPKATSKLQEDEGLMKAAKVSAEKQLKQLVGAVSLSKPEVSVEFKEVDANEEKK